ncbi:MAG: rRNA pseudouridine synthase [Akkermansia sp.]|nr:rRNA pseudouridine synthase [Akkermansia sp.]
MPKKALSQTRPDFNLVFYIFSFIITCVMRTDALLARFGYCSRREAPRWIRAGRCAAGERLIQSPAEKVEPADMLVDGEPVEFPRGLFAALYKPAGFTCSHREGGRLVFDLLPARWLRRNPPASMVGRLDKETTGLLLISDDGAFIHRMTSPNRHLPKTYEFTTSSPVPKEAVSLFSSGRWKLEGENKPCLPALLHLRGERSGFLVLREGRYHQVRRMLASVGAPVLTLKRTAVGPLSLDVLKLAEGEWRPIDPAIFD